MDKSAKRHGFTLVELLIVIVVIGVLSAMMMLSSTEAVSSARAADIISDLRNLKTAALAWYADNLDYIEGTVAKTATLTGAFSSYIEAQGKMKDELKADILKYLGNEDVKGVYSFCVSKENLPIDERWYVCCNVTSDAKVREKLASRASSVGLFASDEGQMTVSETTYNQQNYVVMRIR